jgi:protein-histidine pros-kinase
MDDYISKPLRADELFAALARVCAASDKVQAPPEAKERPAGSAYDRDAALARIEGDTELLHEMFRLFSDQAEQLMAEVSSATTARDGSKLERAAHKLTGSLGNLSAGRAYSAARRLETMGRKGDWTDADTACADLEQEMNWLQEELKTASEEFAECAS